jgi:hypothetical protein
MAKPFTVSTFFCAVFNFVINKTLDKHCFDNSSFNSQFYENCFLMVDDVVFDDYMWSNA